MACEVIRDLAAFVGASASAIVAFATWQALRAHRKPLEFFFLDSGVANQFYLVRISLANRTPSDRQVDEAWLDLAAPAKEARAAIRAFGILTRTVRRILRRGSPDLAGLSVRVAVRQAGRNWVAAAGVQPDTPLYVPFKIGGFGTQEGTLAFVIFPWDEDLLQRHGTAANGEFLDMLGQKVERGFMARLAIRDDRGKTRTAWARIPPPRRAVG